MKSIRRHFRTSVKQVVAAVTQHGVDRVGRNHGDNPPQDPNVVAGDANEPAENGWIDLIGTV